MKVCVCGPICSGKTTFVHYLAKNLPSYKIVIVDDYVKNLYQFNNIAYKMVKTESNRANVDLFTNQKVDKVKLRAYLLNNHHFKKEIEHILWFNIRIFLYQMLTNYSKIIVELGNFSNNYFYKELNGWFDYIIVISGSWNFLKPRIEQRCTKGSDLKLFKTFYFSWKLPPKISSFFYNYLE